MGCFKSQAYKQGKNQHRIEKVSFGQNSREWSQSLDSGRFKKFIISDINSMPDHPAFSAIEKDVTRTFPNQAHFQNDQNLNHFRSVLKRFACSYPKVGYTQGLNFIAGYLLLNKIPESEALECLSSICVHPDLMCIGLYEDNFPLATLYCDMFWKLLEELDRELFESLQKIGLPDCMWIFQWFITFFIYSFPIEYVQQFWTFIFKEKHFAMVKLSVSKVIEMRKKITEELAFEEECEFILFLESLKDIGQCRKLLDINQVIVNATKIPNSITEKCLASIQKSNKSRNFYLKYFRGSKQQKESFYKMFVEDICEKKAELRNSIKNPENRNSFKRSDESVKILDQILSESVKRSRDKKYKSNLDSLHSSHVFISNLGKKYFTQANLPHEGKQIQETNQSIVKKVDIPK